MNKGYRVTCTSWENDGDYYNTNFVTVDSKELALAIRELCLLSVSKYKKMESVILVILHKRLRIKF